MTLGDLTKIATLLNRELDKEHRLDVTETRKHIHAQDLFDWLPDKMSSQELRIHHAREEGEQILAAFSDLDQLYKGDFNARSNGFCLLLAYTIELIQSRKWTDASDVR
jgi:hypothetical protein